MDYIVKDSSQWQPASALAAYHEADNSIRVGQVRETYQAASSEIKYIVEVNCSGKPVPMTCTVMVRFGGVANYEEYSLRGYTPNGIDVGSPALSYDVKTGDVVLVACIAGQYREGVIIGGVRHPSRKSELKSGELAYISKFNGIENKITKTGAYRRTQKATVTATLDAAPAGVPIIPPLDNPTVGGTYYELGDDGSYTVTDGLLQTLKIDKSGSTTTITSGGCSIKLDAKGFETTIDSPSIKINSNLSTTITASTLKTKSIISTSIKAPKIAIGNDAFELIDGLITLIDAIGNCIVISPVGPCNSINMATGWLLGVENIKIKLMALKGSL